MKYDYEGIFIVPPWIYPPFDARWFDEVADESLAPGEEKTIIEFETPLSSPGVIKWFGQGITNDTEQGFINIVWKLRIDGGPDKVYGNVIGEISSILNPTEVFITFKGNTKIELIVQNTSSTTTYSVVGRLKGWYWFELKENNVR